MGANIREIVGLWVIKTILAIILAVLLIASLVMASAGSDTTWLFIGAGVLFLTFPLLVVILVKLFFRRLINNTSSGIKLFLMLILSSFASSLVIGIISAVLSSFIFQGLVDLLGIGVFITLLEIILGFFIEFRVMAWVQAWRWLR